MLKRRDKIAARQVCPVVLHAVEGRFDLRRVAFKRPGQSLPNAGKLRNHPPPFAREPRHANGKEEFGGKPRVRISRHRHMVDLTDRYAGFLQAVADRSRGEPGGVLDAVEALFFNGGDQFSVTNEGRRGIAVVSVDPENVHRQPKKSTSNCFTRMSTNHRESGHSGCFREDACGTTRSKRRATRGGTSLSLCVQNRPTRLRRPPHATGAGAPAPAPSGWPERACRASCGAILPTAR